VLTDLFEFNLSEDRHCQGNSVAQAAILTTDLAAVLLSDTLVCMYDSVSGTVLVSLLSWVILLLEFFMITYGASDGKTFQSRP